MSSSQEDSCRLFSQAHAGIPSDHRFLLFLMAWLNFKIVSFSLSLSWDGFTQLFRDGQSASRGRCRPQRPELWCQPQDHHGDGANDLTGKVYGPCEPFLCLQSPTTPGQSSHHPNHPPDEFVKLDANILRRLNN